MDGVTGIKMHWRCAFQRLFLVSLTIPIFYGKNVYAELLSRDLVQWICSALQFKNCKDSQLIVPVSVCTVHAWKVLWLFSLWNEYSFDGHVQFCNLWKPPKYIELNIWWFFLHFCSLFALEIFHFGSKFYIFSFTFHCGHI